MADFRLHWDDADEGDDSFQEIELLYCPRIGEAICFPLRDTQTEEVLAEIVADVVEVIHVAESDDFDAYVELTLSARSQTNVDEEEERLCRISGKITPEMREALVRAAMKEIRRKEKLHDATGVLGRVQM